MLVFPCAKINLGLNVVEKRPDGYHNLETVFYPIPLTDALEVTPMHDKYPLESGFVRNIAYLVCISIYIKGFPLRQDLAVVQVMLRI